MILLLACAPEKDADARPVVDAVAITPALTTDSVAVASVDAHDPDGDSLTLRFRWHVDDAVYEAEGDSLSGTDFRSVDTTITRFDRGQQVWVEVTASDGVRDSEPVSSAPVTVADSAPGTPTVTITEADGALSCSADTPTDPDGDPVSLTWSWTVDGAPFAADIPAISAMDAARGRAWTCTATPTDGALSGSPAAASLTLDGPVANAYAFVTVARLPQPTSLAFLPDGTLLVATLPGGLARIDPSTGTILGQATVADPMDQLVGLALHPEFGDGAHDWAYLWADGRAKLTRIRLTLDPLTVTESATLIDLAHSGEGGHCGGDVQFWDGEGEPRLYLAIGPNGTLEGQDEGDGGEQLSAFTVDDATGDLTPVSGPFADPGAVAIGFRNPWRLADCGIGLCVGDTGKDDFEEIDLYRSPGQNFGWADEEGPAYAWDAPTRYWAHTDATFVAEDRDGPGKLQRLKVPAVGPVLSARGYGGRLEGRAFFADFYDGWVRAFSPGAADGDVPVANLQYATDFAEAPDGTVYATELGGSVVKLVLRAERPTVGPVGQSLTEAGFGGTVYDVRYPLWSNGADKERRIQLPEGATIDVSDPAHWLFPVGTRLWKTFSVEGTNVETRVIEKTADGWIPGVYLWNGDDAYLTDGTRQDLVLTDGGYTVPSQTTCARCHDATRGDEWPIGFEAFQLGPEGLHALAPLFGSNPGTAPDIDTDDDLDRDVRGYLHGNCAYCHQSGAVVSQVSSVSFSWRYDGAVDAVGAQSWYYDDYFDTASGFGTSDMLVIDPGDAEDSVVVQLLQLGLMPPVSVWRHDAAFLTQIERWIDRMEP